MFSPLLLGCLAIFSLLGYARTATFVINKSIFKHRTDIPILKWVILTLVPIFAALTLLFIPLFRQRFEENPSPTAIAGALWLAFTACIGLYWIIERGFTLASKKQPKNVRLVAQQILRLRRGHLPRLLQKLGLHNDVYDLEVNRFEIEIADLPPSFHGYRIAFLSDLHVASFMDRKLYRTCLEQVREQHCDLVLFGGDFVSWNRHIPLLIDALLKGIDAPDGIYAVLGNHDYWSNAEAVTKALTDHDVHVLHNRFKLIQHDDGAICIAGIEEMYRGAPDVHAAVGSIRQSTPRIVISHHPDVVELTNGERIDLLLCGHTHGGQIRVPYFGALLVPAWREGKYDQGFFERPNLLMYVSRGIGAVPPVRILCRPELPIFELVPRR